MDELNQINSNVRFELEKCRVDVGSIRCNAIQCIFDNLSYTFKQLFEIIKGKNDLMYSCVSCFRCFRFFFVYRFIRGCVHYILMALSENSEQMVLVRWLRRNRILFCAVPNGGYRNVREARTLKRTGVIPGVPDILIFDSVGEYVGCALEMKREGATQSSVRKEQRQWLSDLAERGWATLVGFGSDDAVEKLRELGYGQ